MVMMPGSLPDPPAQFDLPTSILGKAAFSDSTLIFGGRGKSSQLPRPLGPMVLSGSFQSQGEAHRVGFKGDIVLKAEGAF